MNRQRISRLGRALLRDERGITGLETAIILIAFVVVASVFAFTVLSTGLFSAERGKETVHAGLKEAQGSPVLKGSLIAYKGAIDDDGVTPVATTDGVLRVLFKLTNAVAGEPVDLSPKIKKVSPTDACDTEGEPGANQACYAGDLYDVKTDNVTIINYRDEDQRKEDIHWELSWLGKCQETTCDVLLEAGETALLTIWLHTQRDIDASGYTLAYVKEADAGDTDADHLTTLLLKKTEFLLEVVPPQGSVILLERTTPALLETVMNMK